MYCPEGHLIHDDSIVTDWYSVGPNEEGMQVIMTCHECMRSFEGHIPIEEFTEV